VQIYIIVLCACVGEEVRPSIHINCSVGLGAMLRRVMPNPARLGAVSVHQGHFTGSSIGLIELMSCRGSC